MAISIRTAHKHVFSELYNKQNAAIIAILLIAGSICYYIGNSGKFAFYIIYGLCGFITVGISAYTINKVINRRKDIVPHLFKDAVDILKIAFKTLGGGLLLAFILGAAGTLIMLICSKILPLLIIFGIVFFVAVCLYWIAAYANYCTNLKVSQWTNFRKTFKLLKKARIFVFAWKEFLISIPLSIITGICSIPAISSNITGAVICGIISGAFQTLYLFYSADLLGQMMHEVIPKPVKKTEQNRQ